MSMCERVKIAKSLVTFTRRVYLQHCAGKPAQAIDYSSILKPTNVNSQNE